MTKSTDFILCYQTLVSSKKVSRVRHIFAAFSEYMNCNRHIKQALNNEKSDVLSLDSISKVETYSILFSIHPKKIEFSGLLANLHVFHVQTGLDNVPCLGAYYSLLGAYLNCLEPRINNSLPTKTKSQKKGIEEENSVIPH